MKSQSAAFRNKTIVITGGSSGIGLATAHEFARLGSHLALIARRESLLEQAAEELRQEHPGIIVKTFACDIAQNDQITKTIKEIGEKMGGIHVLICSAGTAVCGRFADISPDQQKMVMDVNYFGSVQAIKASLPYLTNSKGHIGLVSSVAGYMGAIGYSGYAPSKFAVTALAECLRMEMKHHNITTSIVYPPDTDTPMYHHEQEHQLPETKKLSQNAKLLQPEEVAGKFVKAIVKGKFEVYCNTESKVVRLARNLTPSLFYRMIDKISGI